MLYHSWCARRCTEPSEGNREEETSTPRWRQKVPYARCILATFLHICIAGTITAVLRYSVPHTLFLDRHRELHEAPYNKLHLNGERFATGTVGTVQLIDNVHSNNAPYAQGIIILLWNISLAFLIWATLNGPKTTIGLLTVIDSTLGAILGFAFNLQESYLVFPGGCDSAGSAQGAKSFFAKAASFTNPRKSAYDVCMEYATEGAIITIIWLVKNPALALVRILTAG